MLITKNCEFCGRQFQVQNTTHGNRKRFCNTSCSAKWRIKTFGVAELSESGRQILSDTMKQKWTDENFRESVIERMTTNNPVYIDGVTEKAKLTRLKRGSYSNNYRYGNGKISEYESRVMCLLDYGFYYNYAIKTKLYKDAFPDISVPNSYKPDFVNLQKRLCIEIDGNNHNCEKMRELDIKKTKCLEYLGFTVIRFTHTMIDNGEFEKWLNSWLEENSQN